VEELAVQARPTSCCVAAAPVPVSDSTAGEFPALLANESVPAAVPELVGENCTAMGTLWPAGMVNGKDIPLTVNSELVVVAEEITTLEPEALRVADIVVLDPTATLPRFALAGETAKVPPAVPLPKSGMVSALAPAFETTVRPPVAEPLVVGTKSIWNVRLFPGTNVTGGVNPVLAKAEPLVLADEIVSEAVPTLVSVSKTLPLLPTCTLPKFTLEGLAETLAADFRPFSDRSRVELAASLMKAIVPAVWWDDWGTNWIVTSTLCPAASVSGNAGAVTL